MKKYIAKAWSVLTVLVCVMLLCSASVADESIDPPNLSKLSDDELLRLISDAELEYQRRSENFQMQLKPGVYEIGRDMAEGRYLCTAIKKTWNGIVVYASRSIYETMYTSSSFGGDIQSYDTVPGEQYSLELNSGNILIIRDDPIDCQKVASFQAQEAAAYVVPGGVEIPAGIYVTGKEIPAGAYRVSFNGKRQSYLYLHKSYEHLQEWHRSNYTMRIKLNEQMVESTIRLQEGVAILIEYGSCIFTPIKAFDFSGF